MEEVKKLCTSLRRNAKVMMTWTRWTLIDMLMIGTKHTQDLHLTSLGASNFSMRSSRNYPILVPRGHDPFSQHQGSRSLVGADFWACAEYLFCIFSQSDLPDLTKSPWIADFSLLVFILGADQKDCGLWGWEWKLSNPHTLPGFFCFAPRSPPHEIPV